MKLLFAPEDPFYPIAGAGVAALIPNHTEEECIRRAKILGIAE